MLLFLCIHVIIYPIAALFSSHYWDTRIKHSHCSSISNMLCLLRYLASKEDFSLHVFSEDVIGLPTSPCFYKAVGHLGPHVFAPMCDEERQRFWDLLWQTVISENTTNNTKKKKSKVVES